MPVFSSKRGASLLTAVECAHLFQKSVRTIEGRIQKRSGVYRESVKVKPGVKPTILVDPSTLGYPLESYQTERVDPPKQAGDGIVKSSLSPQITKPQADFAVLQAILALGERSQERAKAVEVLAKTEGVTPRAVYRWLEAVEQKGPKGLARAARSDKGGRHLPPSTYQLIVQGIGSNPLTTAVAQVHRTLMRAVPAAMTRDYGGKQRPISVDTIRDIKRSLLSDPNTRLLFADADARKEHLRTYAGEVFAAYANELWQLDMTRCDTVVCDLETGRIFRPRVHAIIDVYSGCIPGWAFSIKEDQAQTDLALLRAFVPKPEPYATAWPVYGTPQRLYVDNGKTYTSEHARRFLSELGVEVIHSRPRVSHTRGKIERFFGTFHGFEKTLPGYCGANAVEKATEELRRITKNTRRWLERGLTQDPGWGNRLLTLAEYQERVLAWLFIDYHDTVVDKRSRLMHFVETAPKRTQLVYNRDELMTILARQTVRKVYPDGSIRLNNRLWTVESGKLINHVNREVIVLSNQFADAEEHLIAWRDSSGRLEIIGQAVPMPERADSPEAQALRMASRAEAKRAQLEAAQQRKDLFDPKLVVSNALLAQAQAEYLIEPLPPAQLPKARLKALEGEQELDDDLTRFIKEQTAYKPGQSAEEILEASNKLWRGRGKL